MNLHLATVARKRVAVAGGGGPIFTRSLTIDHTKVPSDQNNFPVMVKITSPTLKTVANGGHVQRSDGFDIGFYDDNVLTTKLQWEMEFYDGAAGSVVAWVKVGTVSSSGASPTTFYMSYGDASITTDQSSPAAVWSNGFVSVYHLGNGTTLSVADSLGANNGTNNGVTAATGMIDGGGNFVAASIQYINLGTGIHPSAITQSAWVRATSYPGSFNAVIVRNDGTFITGAWINSSGQLAPFFTTTTVPVGSNGSHTMAVGTWYHVVVTYDNVSGMKNYVNAASDYTAAAAGTLQANAAAVYIGKDPANANFEWNGQIDEVRVASVARSADWVTTEYNNQSSPGTFITVGAET